MKRLIKFFLLVYLLVFPFGQITRLPIQFLGPEVRIYLGDVLVGLIVGTWGIWRIREIWKKGGLTNLPAGRQVLIFVGVATLSLVINLPRLAFSEILVSSLYLFRWVVYAGLYFVVTDIVKTKNHLPAMLRKALQAGKPKIKNPLNSSSLLALLMFVGGMTAIFGLIQYFFFPDLRGWLEMGNWDPHYYRAYGTFLDPGYFGMIMVLTLILIISDHLRGHQGSIVKGQLLRVALLVVSYLALALSYSRASYLAFLVGMGVISWRLKKPKFFGVILGVFLITILLLPRPGGEGVRLERQSTIEARIRNWKQSLIIVKDHPILGVGFNAYRYAQRDYGFLEEENWQESHAGAGADSSFLFVLATTGIVGLGAYLWLLKSVYDGIGCKSDLSGYRLVILASLSALLVHSLFLNSLFYPWTMGWMWILLGGILWV